MRIKLFGNKAEPACMYCKFGKRNGEADKVFCQKKGIVSAIFSCRKYEYDPLKRVPNKAELHSDLTKEDFDI